MLAYPTALADLRLGDMLDSYWMKVPCPFTSIDGAKPSLPQDWSHPVSFFKGLLPQDLSLARLALLLYPDGVQVGTRL